MGNTNLRTVFDKDAERYNHYRPHYPRELFAELIQQTGITKQSELLEIGPGTGQATIPLARLGCNITGVEIGKSLAQQAQAELASYPNVKIVTDSFEHVVLPNAHFDLIYSATAFHWVNDAFKYTKTAALLKPKGHLAIIHTEHVSDGAGDHFFHASRPIHAKYWPEDPKNFMLPTLDQLHAPAIDTRLFMQVNYLIFPTVITYTAKEYVGLLGTYSPVIALPHEQRQQYLADIEALINKEFNGALHKHFAFTLAISLLA